MSDGSGRRPQYGEYATPEQQRAAIKDPQKNPHYAPPEASVHPHPSQDADVRGVTGEQAGASAPSPQASAFLRHPTDRVATITLLVLGLYSVISAFSGRGDIAAQITQAYHGLGLSGDYVATAQTTAVGDVVAIVSLVLWVLALGLSLWSIARGRVAFWIPLSAGVLAFVVRAVGYGMLMAADPTFVHWVGQMK